MAVKLAFKPPPAKVIVMKPLDRLRTNKVPISALVLRDRGFFYVVTVSNLRPRTSGL
jgi:Zn-finger domain-containing protein